jgi:Tol biopolymer transport system component
LLATSVPNGIALRRPDGQREDTITAPPSRIHFGFGMPIQWSRDGSRLLYVTAKGPRRGQGFWATEIGRDGGDLSQTPLGTELAFPAFSPRGWPLVFATGPYEFLPNGERRGPSPGLRTLAGPGANPRIILATSGLPEDPVVSPDGKRVLFKQWGRGRTELWTVGMDGSEPRRLAEFLYVRHYEWSPDGKQIALSAIRARSGEAGHQLYLMPAEGGTPKHVGNAELVSGPVWAPDGRWLTYATTDGSIERVRPSGGKAETIAYLKGESISSLRWSPNGRYLAYSAVPFPDEYD